MESREQEHREVFHIKYQGKDREVESLHTERGTVFLVELDNKQVLPINVELDEHSNQMWLEEGIATERAAELGALIEAALL